MSHRFIQHSFIWNHSSKFKFAFCQLMSSTTTSHNTGVAACFCLISCHLFTWNAISLWLFRDLFYHTLLKTHLSTKTPPLDEQTPFYLPSIEEQSLNLDKQNKFEQNEHTNECNSAVSTKKRSKWVCSIQNSVEYWVPNRITCDNHRWCFNILIIITYILRLMLERPQCALSNRKLSCFYHHQRETRALIICVWFLYPYSKI